MKATDAKPFVGKFVSYKKVGSTSVHTGIVLSTGGKNIIMDDTALWAPDISEMQLMPTASDAQIIVDWWLAQKPSGVEIAEYLEQPAHWVVSSSKSLALRAAELYRQMHPGVITSENND